MITTMPDNKDWEKTDSPVTLQKYVRPWMPHRECFTSHSGEILLQRYPSDKFNICYLATDLKREALFSYQQETAAVALVFSLKGALRTSIANSEAPIHLSEKMYFSLVIPVGVNTEMIAPGVTEILHFQLSPAYLDPIMDDFETLASMLQVENVIGHTHSTPPLKIDYYVENILKKDFFAKQPQQLINVKIKTAVYSLLAHYESELSIAHIKQAPTGKYEDVIEKIKQEIQEHPNRTLLTEDYFAKKYALGKVTLNRYFKIVTGETLAGYRQTQSMITAQKMIAEGMTFAEIADYLGYTEPTNFSAAFKEYFGHRPSHYKNNSNR